MSWNQLRPDPPLTGGADVRGQLERWEQARETGALGGALAPILSEALEGASSELAQLTADTLSSPEVDAAVTRLGWKVAAFAAGGVAVGIVAGLFIWRRL